MKPILPCLLILSYFILGCGNSSSEGGAKINSCSQTAVNEFNYFQSIKKSGDPLLLASSCSRLLNVLGAQKCQSLDSQGQPLILGYSEVEKECKVAQAMSAKANTDGARASLIDAKTSCSPEITKAYRDLVSKIIELQYGDRELMLGETFAATLRACGVAQNAFAATLKCSADISNRKRWISWAELAPQCEQAEGDYRKFLEKTDQTLKKADGEWSALNIDSKLALQIPIVRMPMLLKMRVRSGLDMTSIFALNSESMDIFYSKGAIVGKKAATRNLNAGEIVCGLTREDANLSLQSGDIFDSKRVVVRDYEEDIDYKRTILRFEGDSKRLFWISCLSGQNRDLTSEDLLSAFGSLFELRIFMKSQTNSGGDR